LRVILALAVLACGGAVIFIYQLRAGVSEAVTGWNPKAHTVPAALLWVVVGAGGIHVATSLDTILRVVALAHRPIRNVISLTALVFGGVAVAVAVFSATRGLIPAWHHGPWQKVAVVLAFAAPLPALA